MLKSWICLSLRHQNAKLEVRERYALQDVHRTQFLGALKKLIIQDFNLGHLAHLKHLGNSNTLNHLDFIDFIDSLNLNIWCLITCNRCEVYVEYKNHLNTTNDLGFQLPASQLEIYLIKTWASFLIIDTKLEEDLKQHLNIFKDLRAVQHLFEVACGLDSINLGETQITRQIKQQIEIQHELNQEYQLNQQNQHQLNIKSPVSAFEFLINKAFECAKKVRHQTDITQYSVSIGAIAMRLAEKIFNSISEQHLMIIGAGMMMQNILPYFLDAQPKSLKMINRSQQGLDKLKKHFQGHAFFQNLNHINIEELTFTDLTKMAQKKLIDQHILQADIVITCTHSPHILIDSHMLQANLKKRRFKPLFCVDLSLPRNIDPQAHQLDNLFLYSIEDLGLIASQSQEKRLEAKEKAAHIIANQLQEFKKIQERQALKDVILVIHQYFEKLIQSIDLSLNPTQYKKIRRDYKHQEYIWLKHLESLSFEQAQALISFFENKNKPFS